MAVVYVPGPARSGKSAFGVRLASEPDGTEFVLRPAGKPIGE
jgi:adenosyl cobinamide kinase/adenosyl cobinamide phosphate guanylyltransferase